MESNNAEQVIFSSAIDYEVSLAVFHASHGLPTPASGDKKHSEGDHAKERRRDAARRTNIWK